VDSIQRRKERLNDRNSKRKTNANHHVLDVLQETSKEAIMSAYSNGSPKPRHADARRKVLNEELTVPTVSNFFPIERYYDAADKVYASFQAIMQTSGSSISSPRGDSDDARQLLDNAYVYGKRYCSFVLNAIPEHNYYSSQKYAAFKAKHQRQVDRVLTQLERVGNLMDVQQEAIQKRLEEERLRIEQQQYEELISRAARQQQQQQQRQTQNSTASSKNDVGSSAMNKLELLFGKSSSSSSNNVGTPAPEQHPSNTIRRDPSGEEPVQSSTRRSSSSRYRLQDEDLESEDDDYSGGGAVPLPPPILPPSATGPTSSSSSPGTAAPPPPSYNEVVATARNGRYHRRTFLGPESSNNEQHRSSSSLSSSSLVRFDLPGDDESLALQRTKTTANKRRERIPMRKLQDQYRQDYLHYQSVGKIQVSGIDTYQGRMSNSTNGCTVISALVAAFHLANSTGVTDRAIMQVIDRDCGPLLREIRSKLGLDGCALIIPSDVHDHLVDKHILRQEAFVGAAGGNVMDPDHMGEFLKLLSVGEDGKGAGRKGAATFFFREHVICIVKSAPLVNGRTSSPTSYYELVDSLPGLSSDGRSKATRTRCKDLDALQVLMRFYTSRKFSDSNCSYIDRNAWDDSMADFDPRVFQGFVWAV
jgi:hypothetical protein